MFHGTLAPSPYLLQISACGPVAVAPDLPFVDRRWGAAFQAGT